MPIRYVIALFGSRLLILLMLCVQILSELDAYIFLCFADRASQYIYLSN